MNSKQKGNRGEREAAEFLTDLLGTSFVRGKQISGDFFADVVCIDGNKRPRDIGLHFEVKRDQRLNVEKALKQAEDDARDTVPIVIHRKNHEEWKFTVRSKDLPQLYKELKKFYG